MDIIGFGIGIGKDIDKKKGGFAIPSFFFRKKVKFFNFFYFFCLKVVFVVYI